MPEETKTPEPPPAPDLGKLVEAAVAKHGDQTSALKAFAADLYSARDDLKAVRSKLPGEGSIVLSGDDAKAWGAYQSIGKPADLRKTVDEHGTFATENAALKRDEVLRGVADQAKVNVSVLRKLAGPGLVFETAKVKGKDGKEADVLHVKDMTGAKEGQTVASVPFDDYAAAHWADFLPALRPGAKAADPVRPPGTPNRLDPSRPYTPPVNGSNLAPPIDAGARLLAAARTSF